MTWAQITTIAVPGARIATGQPHFYHCIIFHSTCTVKWAREVCLCVCNEVPFASHPWQSTHHKSLLALDLLDNICMATHSPCVTCQPSVMERFPYPHEEYLEVDDTWNGSRYKERPQLEVNWTGCEYICFILLPLDFLLIPKVIGFPTLFFYKASFWAVQQFSLIS